MRWLFYNVLQRPENQMRSVSLDGTPESRKKFISDGNCQTNSSCEKRNLASQGHFSSPPPPPFANPHSQLPEPPETHTKRALRNSCFGTVTKHIPNPRGFLDAARKPTKTNRKPTKATQKPSEPLDTAQKHTKSAPRILLTWQGPKTKIETQGFSFKLPTSQPKPTEHPPTAH